MPEPQEEKKADNGARPLRTFQGDVEDILKGGAGSLAKIAVAESDKRARSGVFAPETEQPSHARLIVTISVSLILVGIGTFATLYFLKQPANSPSSVSAPAPIIAADTEKSMDVTGLDRNKIIAAMNKEKTGGAVPLSSVEAVTLTETSANGAAAMSAEKFLSKIEAHAPDALVRSLGSSFVFGIHALATNQPFMVLKTNYYQNAFAGMLSWEAEMQKDLGPIFIPQAMTVGTGGGDQPIGQNIPFEDVVINNRDTRAMRDSAGKIIFLYSFHDKNTIVLTTNADTLEKVAAKLLAVKLVQ